LATLEVPYWLSVSFSVESGSVNSVSEVVQAPPSKGHQVCDVTLSSLPFKEALRCVLGRLPIPFCPSAGEKSSQPQIGLGLLPVLLLSQSCLVEVLAIFAFS